MPSKTESSYYIGTVIIHSQGPEEKSVANGPLSRILSLDDCLVFSHSATLPLPKLQQDKEFNDITLALFLIPPCGNSHSTLTKYRNKADSKIIPS